MTTYSVCIDFDVFLGTSGDVSSVERSTAKRIMDGLRSNLFDVYVLISKKVPDFVEPVSYLKDKFNVPQEKIIVLSNPMLILPDFMVSEDLVLLRKTSVGTYRILIDSKDTQQEKEKDGIYGIQRTSDPVSKINEIADAEERIWDARR